MAEYHLRLKIVQRAAGRSSVAASAYRARDAFTDKRTGEAHDYTPKRGDLAFSEMLWPGMTPLSSEATLANGKSNPKFSRQLAARFHDEFTRDGITRTDILLPVRYPDAIKTREGFWNFVEQRLTHPRAQPAFEIELMLPRELSLKQNIDLVRRFAFDHFASEGLVVDINIHETVAADGKPHPHAHLLIASRRMTPHGDLGKAASDLQDSPLVIKKIYALEQAGKTEEAKQLSLGTNLMRYRAAWADYANDALSDAGSAERIDHRSLKDQALSREATPNIGFSVNNERTDFRGYDPIRIARFDAVAFRNKMRGQMRSIQRRQPDRLADFLRHAEQHAPELIQDRRPPQPEIDHER